MGDPDDLLREILRECESILRYEFRLAEAFDRKAERLIALGVAALGGGSALGLAAPRDAAATPLYPATILVAGVLNMASLLLIATAYGGFLKGTNLEFGPNRAWLEEKSTDTDWRMQDHLASLVGTYRRIGERNRSVLEKLARRRRESVILLAAAALAYGSAYIYVLTGRIGA